MDNYHVRRIVLLSRFQPLTMYTFSQNLFRALKERSEILDQGNVLGLKNLRGGGGRK